jgi:hypothetical protein
MLTEEELYWYEENALRGKNGRDAISHRRSWKLYLDRWDFDDGDQNKYKSDIKCWKRNRKTHYRIKKVHSDKKRKSKEKEHWRYKCNRFKYCSFNYGWKDTLKRINTTNQAVEFLSSLIPGDFIMREDARYWYRDKIYPLKVVERYYDNNFYDSIVVEVIRSSDEYSKRYYIDVDTVKNDYYNYRSLRIDEIYSLGVPA